MRNAYIPEEVVQKVLRNPSMDVETLSNEVNLFQVSTIRDAQNKLQSDDANGVGTSLGGGYALMVGAGSFVSGLLGWLLVMKKRVLQCSVCQATLNAS